MTWILSTVIALLLRAAGPLIRRGLTRLAMAVMATLVCGAALAAGQGLLAVALWLPSAGGTLVTVLLGLLGAALRLAALVGLVTVTLLMPLVITADCFTRSHTAHKEHATSTVQVAVDRIRERLSVRPRTVLSTEPVAFGGLECRSEKEAASPRRPTLPS
ncbi:hypothetical protein [Streptomyces zaomyceticus]|uniref:hypothetical protein n=1 Tax=Streptomyces zaomyceticus TaxID=68286 RepID=UPI002F906F20